MPFLDDVVVFWVNAHVYSDFFENAPELFQSYKDAIYPNKGIDFWDVLPLTEAIQKATPLSKECVDYADTLFRNTLDKELSSGKLPQISKYQSKYDISRLDNIIGGLNLQFDVIKANPKDFYTVLCAVLDIVL